MAGWQRAEPPLDRKSLSDLLANRIPAIRIRAFATPEECRALAEAAEGHFEYDARVDPPIGRIGPTQYGYHDRPKEEYFAAAERARELQRRLFAASFDPLERLFERLRESHTGPVEIAREAGHGPYFAGLVRRIHLDASLHVDFAEVDAAGWSIADVTRQLAQNLFLAAPETGGECVVYNRPWSPQDEAAKTSELYFDPGLVAGAESWRIEPALGDLVLINTRNLHEVAACSGTRITLSHFLGTKPDGRLVAWS